MKVVSIFIVWEMSLVMGQIPKNVLILLEPKTHLLTPKLYKHIKQTYFNDNLEELQKNYNIVFIHDIENYRYLYYSRLVTKDFELISSYPYVMLYDRNSKKEVLENEGKENNE
jgi:hypothetical protein